MTPPMEEGPAGAPGFRTLIVNADDFGQSPGVNRGVAEAHDRGIVTSASLMVRWPAATPAAGYARLHPELSVGMHFDLGEWAYRDGGWHPVYEVLSTEEASAVRREVGRQLEGFRRLLGRDPTHLDSHQHVHRDQPVGHVLAEVADELGVPLRDHTPGVRYSGEFYGQTGTGRPYPRAITLASLLGILVELPSGITELGCHPGLGRDLDSMYLAEREQEVEVLCHPRVPEAITEEGIRLVSFRDVAPLQAPRPLAGPDGVQRPGLQG
jgi:predicted glycoside hydrolase/deacetylase ChbG (UPF0249 family)